MYFKEHPDEFFTATNLNWLPILESDYHKQILIEALKHRTDKDQLTINAFVIMPNHFHIIWRVHNGIERGAFQRDLMKFTARSILRFMLMNDDSLLPLLKVKAADRQQQVWERNPLPIELDTEKIFMQKLNYIHNNPLQPKWQLCTKPEDYFYSSAKFYETGIDDFGLLTHFRHS
jgi:putative transposase